MSIYLSQKQWKCFNSNNRASMLIWSLLLFSLACPHIYLLAYLCDGSQLQTEMSESISDSAFYWVNLIQLEKMPSKWPADQVHAYQINVPILINTQNWKVHHKGNKINRSEMRPLARKKWTFLKDTVLPSCPQINTSFFELRVGTPSRLSDHNLEFQSKCWPIVTRNWPLMSVLDN